MIDDQKRNRLLEPFADYKKFVADYTGQNNADYANIKRFNINGKKVALVGVNSALICARNKDEKGEVNDYGYLIVGEPQIYDFLNEIVEDDVKIAVLHHPLDWLIEFDKTRTESRLFSNFHFILHGHRHYPQIKLTGGSEGDSVIISGGASYDRRIPNDPRYASAYNFVQLNFETETGNVYLRRWSDRRNGGSWIEDTDTYPNGQYSFPLPKQLGNASSNTSSNQPPLSPKYYIERPPLEQNCMDEIIKPGGFIRIRSPRGMGKQTLKCFLIKYIKQKEYYYINFGATLLTPESLGDYSKFLLTFIEAILIEIPEINEEDKLINQFKSSLEQGVDKNQKTLTFILRNILAKITKPIVIIIASADNIFESANFSNDFLSLLRPLALKYQENQLEIWGQLRLIVIHNTDYYANLDITKSPLQGLHLVVSLPDFNQEQIKNLIEEYQFPKEEREDIMKVLIKWVGGSPLLLSLALSFIKEKGLQSFREPRKLVSLDGLFQQHLNDLYNELPDNLKSEFHKIIESQITTEKPIELRDENMARNLERKGLIKIENNLCSVKYKLYLEYFKQRFQADLSTN